MLKELKEVHFTFLKKVSATVEDFSVKIASRDVAVVTVTNRLSAFTFGTLAYPAYFGPSGFKDEDPFVVYVQPI